jgi:hypothetical protein
MCEEICVEAVEADYAELVLALNTQCLAVRRGLVHRQRTGGIFSEHPLALSLPAIALLRERMTAQAAPEERERAARLYYACVSQFIRMDLLLLDQTLDDFLSHAALRVDAKRVSLAEMIPWIMGEQDFQGRDRLGDSARPLLLKASQLKGRVWTETLRILAEDFGHASYLSFCEEKKGVDLVRLGAQGEAFLAVTDAVYRTGMGEWVQRDLGRPFSGLSRHHAVHLLGLRRFDHGFPGGALMAALQQTLKALGLDEALGSRLLVDLEERPEKGLASRCVPLRVPGEIHVIVTPLGGSADRETLLHEMGHGLHYAYTSPALPYVYRQVPRSFALSECFAFLFQNLTLEPRWLREHSTLSDGEMRALIRFGTLKRLYLFRRYVGKLLFEVALFAGGDLGRAGALYAETLQRATGFVYEPEAALMDLEEEFYSADYLQAWIAEPLLRRHLRRIFGDAWFMEKGAGALLSALWRVGDRWSLTEMLGSLGLDLNDSSPLLDTVVGPLACGD